MSYENTLTNVSVEAGSDLSAGQYKFVKIASDGQIDLVASKGAACDGVLQDKPAAAGRPGSVAVGGISKVLLSGTVAAGGEVIAAADGTGVAQDAVSQYIVGAAVEGGVSGDIIPVKLANYQKPAA